jgi:type IV pilus assembly protein PilO
MTLDDINNLDLKKIADWPMPAKLASLLLLAGVIIAAGWWFLWSDSLAKLDQMRGRELELRAEFTTKKGQAVNLAAYEQQLKDIEQAFGALLKQLPNKQQMDDLITDVNQAGLGRGLAFELFRPGGESMSEFYAELPIEIRVTGGYHDIAAFVSDVARLSRIVTLHDLALDPLKEGGLAMTATARTYRYLDESEIAAQKKPVRAGDKK